MVNRRLGFGISLKFTEMTEEAQEQLIEGIRKTQSPVVFFVLSLLFVSTVSAVVFDSSSP